MTLPEACELCAPFDGAWMEVELRASDGDFYTGMKRCQCARGRTLAEAAKPVVPREPVLSTSAAAAFAEMLAVIPFFPGEAGARSSIADEIACMCGSAEEAQWLVRRMRRLYAKWPGTMEMRLVFCVSRKPLDGIQAAQGSSVYPDGIPSERSPEQPTLAIGDSPAKRLTAREVSAAPSVQETIQDLAKAKSLDRAIGSPIIRPIPTVRTPAGTITQAMVDAAVAENRAKKAREEVGL